MIRLSIILAILIDALLSPGSKVISRLYSPSALKYISHDPEVIYGLIFSFHYVIPTVIIYIALRVLHIDTRIRITKSISIILSIAISIFFFLFFMKYIGGIESFIISQVGIFAIVPAWILVAVGLCKTLKSKNNLSNQEHSKVHFSTKEKIILPLVVLAALLPVMDSNKYEKTMQDNQKLFDEQCPLARETISYTPTDIKGIFLEESGYNTYSNIQKNSNYTGFSGSAWGGVFLNQESIPFLEMINYENDSNVFKYVYFDQNNWGGSKTNEIKSNYRVKQKKELLTENPAIEKITTTVTNLTTDQEIASSVYIRSFDLNKVCGRVDQGDLSELDFLLRVFGLPKNK